MPRTKNEPSARTTLVVDGSNIATEGRSLPSLAQLDEAVSAFIVDHHYDTVAVIVDATFGHRIESSESARFEEAILAGELVTPPAGAIGRGDALILQVADKTGATVLSNDSFQEFHGTHEWLFTEGRLIGGKPVPGIGWVFVARSPVRGPISRRSVKESKQGGASEPRSRSRRSASADLGPMPVPTSPPPCARRPRCAGRSNRRSGGRAVTSGIEASVSSGWSIVWCRSTGRRRRRPGIVASITWREDRYDQR